MLVRICSRFLIPIATTLIVCLDYCGIFITSPAFNYPFIFYLNCYLGPYLQYLILYNYFLIVLTNPGYTITHNNSSIETGNSIETVVCKKCQIIKPLRAQHCSICNRCTLRMDHHCPFVNNCIRLYIIISISLVFYSIRVYQQFISPYLL
jgi:palmitoyltransferase ZDHHC6